MVCIPCVDDSDLNLNIDKENFTSAVPSHDQGFAYMWAGVRSTYGFKSGKIYFDVKVGYLIEQLRYFNIPFIWIN